MWRYPDGLKLRVTVQDQLAAVEKIERLGQPLIRQASPAIRMQASQYLGEFVLAEYQPLAGLYGRKPCVEIFRLAGERSLQLGDACLRPGECVTVYRGSLCGGMPGLRRGERGLQRRGQPRLLAGSAAR